MQCPSCRIDFDLKTSAAGCPNCGHSFIDSYYSREALPQGFKLKGDYTVGEQIGLGAWALVYSASHPKHGPVAIKEYYPPGCQREEGRLTAHGRIAAWEFKKGLTQMAGEAEMMSRFTHRGLLRCVDFFQENGTAYLVSELLAGDTLQQMATREAGRLPEKQVMPYLEQLLAALDTLGRARVVHADIKPENIMVTPEGRVVLLDFGAAMELTKGTKAGDSTPAYAAPEQLDGGSPGLWTDLYGLCATVYHLLTGVLPTSARDRVAGARLPEPPTRLVSSTMMENLRRGLRLNAPTRPSVAQMRQGMFAAFAPKVTMRAVATLTGHERGLVSLDFSPDSKYLISADEGGTVLLWRIPEIQRGNAHPVKLFQHRGLSQAGFSPDGKLMASSSRQGSLKMWAPPSGRELSRPLIFDGDPIVGFAFSPTGGDMAVGYANGTTQLWKQPGRLARVMEGHATAITCLAFSPDGQTLATSSTDKTTRLWDLTQERDSMVLKGHTRTVQYLAFSPEGGVLATASHDRSIRLWDVSTGQEIETILNQSGAIIGVEFVPHIGGLLTASGDGKLRLLRLNPTTEAAAARHEGVFRALACAASGALVATAQGDKTIQLWSISG